MTRCQCVGVANTSLGPGVKRLGNGSHTFLRRWECSSHDSNSSSCSMGNKGLHKPEQAPGQHTIE